MFDKVTMTSGAFAGVVGTLLGYPLDTIKSRFASTGDSSVRHAVEIVRGAGFRGLYSGVASPLVSLVILNTMSFSTFNSFASFLGVKTEGRPASELEPRLMFAGGLSGLIASWVSTPFELLKIQMQLHGREFSGIRDVASRIVRKRGFSRGIYTGYQINTAREFIFCSTYFGMYEHTKTLYEGVFPSSVAIPVAGGGAGALAWALSYPLDCVKTHIQGRRLVGAVAKDEPAPPRSWAVARDLVRSRGIGGLYAGLGPSLLRAFVVSGSRFSAFEVSKWLLCGALTETGGLCTQQFGGAGP